MELAIHEIYICVNVEQKETYQEMSSLYITNHYD